MSSKGDLFGGSYRLRMSIVLRIGHNFSSGMSARNRRKVLEFSLLERGSEFVAITTLIGN